jgi:hypothetical protein
MGRPQRDPAPEPDEDEGAGAPPPRIGPRRISNYRSDLLTKRFRLPPGLQVREVVVRELVAADELTAALWTESNAPADMLETPAGQIHAEQRELVRISLVEVDGEEVNVDGVPFMAMDKWSLRTFRAVRTFFNDVNTLDDRELRKSLAAAEVVIAGPAAAGGKGGDNRAG